MTVYKELMTALEKCCFEKQPLPPMSPPPMFPPPPCDNRKHDVIKP